MPARALAESLHLDALESLRLDDNTLDKLAELSLADNQFGTRGLRHLAGAARMPHLATLVLDGNNLDDDAMRTIAAAKAARALLALLTSLEE